MKGKGLGIRSEELRVTGEGEGLGLRGKGLVVTAGVRGEGLGVGSEGSWVKG